jgi:SAM-dependent methyltransferase
VRLGTVEELPDFDMSFDVVTSQLVVNFMTDAEAGVRAMRDATRKGGIVASCVWDYADAMTMLRAFWDAALELDPDAPDEGRTMPHCSRDGLYLLWQRSGLEDIETGELHAEARYQDFDDFWSPFPLGLDRRVRTAPHSILGDSGHFAMPASVASASPRGRSRSGRARGSSAAGS